MTPYLIWGGFVILIIVAIAGGMYVLDWWEDKQYWRRKNAEISDYKFRMEKRRERAESGGFVQNGEGE